MGEYKSLDEWFEGKDRGDGRKFTREGIATTHFFEPIFRDPGGVWFGLSEKGAYQDEFGSIRNSRCARWGAYHPPKRMKKIKMYRAIFKNPMGEYSAPTGWYSAKHYFATSLEIVTYAEKEIGVPDDGTE